MADKEEQPLHRLTWKQELMRKRRRRLIAESAGMFLGAAAIGLSLVWLFFFASECFLGG